MAGLQPTTSADSAEFTPAGVIVCPLRFEQKQLLASDALAAHTVECCGPGEAGIKRWFAMNHERISAAPWLLLVGVAGAVDPAITPGSAHVVATVIDREGGRHHAVLKDHAAASADGVIATSSPEIIRDRQTRANLFRACGAQLVDQESIAFARCAGRVQRPWGIIRGISDGTDTSLPRGLEHWVDASGRTRPGRIMRGLLRAPAEIPRMIHLGRMSTRAMRAAAETALRLIEEFERSAATARVD